MALAAGAKLGPYEILAPLGKGGMGEVEPFCGREPAGEIPSPARDQMVAPGTKLGPYEILSLLGKGGMGEVYRAHDTKLGREVALKVLPQAFAADPMRLARFEREAHLLASLNHPNIAAIYGFEESGSVEALVMELVEGRTLAERIAVAPAAAGPQSGPAARRGEEPQRRKTGPPRRALQLSEALPIAQQIAEALEYAHERGIIHRDLKPANIKLTEEGAVKVLDFGLAKALDPASSPPTDAEAAELQNSPTLTTMATQAGMIMGTAAYMSPEQARGKPVDRRADIWAFGCVLYEMLTGKKAFDGETVSDVLAAVITKDPDWSALPPNTPAHVRVLLQRCLQKDPKQRLRDMGDARISLDEVLSGAAQEQMASAGLVPSVSRRVLPWAVGVVIGAVAAGLVVWRILAPSPESPMHFSAVTSFAGVQAQPALSPDGRSVAFVSNKDGHYNIYVGLISGSSLVQITNDANLKVRPAWSPDGTTLAYARLNHSGLWDIWEVLALGGTPRRVILNATDPAWSPDGRTLAYESGADDSLWISRPEGEDAHRILPAPPWQYRYTQSRFSPDGRQLAFLLRAIGPAGELEVVDLASHRVRKLPRTLPVALSPAWSPDGRYLYFASSRGGTMNIWRIPATGGRPEQITAGQGDDAELDVSTDGKKIVFSTWRTRMNIARLELDARSGQQSAKLLTTDPARNQVAPAYSPDGKHLAYFSDLKGVENESIWVSDADGSNPVQLVGDERINVFPHWTPDGQRVFYRSWPQRPGRQQRLYELRSVSISGGAPDTIYKYEALGRFDVGIDGRILYLNSKREAAAFDPRSGEAAVLGRIPIPASQRGTLLRFSPDGRSVAYILGAARDNDPNAGLWVTDFKTPPRQIVRGWIVWFARGPHDEIYLLEGQPDLNGALWRVGWDGKGLEQIPTTIPLIHSYWANSSQNSEDFFDVSPDGRYVAFGEQTVLDANIGMIQDVH